jgi:major vault protein
MVYGPSSYIPSVEVEVIDARKKIPLDKNEGVYVRDTRSGLVRVVLGETYMLKAHEELWDMDLPDTVEKLLSSQMVGKKGARVKSKVVTCKNQIFLIILCLHYHF